MQLHDEVCDLVRCPRWHDDLRGRAHIGVLDRPAGSGSGRSRSGARREGRGDRGPPPPARGVTPAGGPSPLHPGRPDAARDAGAAAATGTLAAVPGDPRDAAALAMRREAPRSYPRLSWEELGGTFLGLMTYLDLKG